MAGIAELFVKRLPVHFKSSDREDRNGHIQICVEIHTTVSPMHKKELVVRLTDASDLFFLYTLRLSEEDFQSLKSQQGLLVDYTAFPQKFTDLLELCLQEEHKESPKFIIHLISNGASGTSTACLNLIETNPFKHLTHLSLKFLPGSDGDIKKYLAHCLKTLKDQNALLLKQLEHTESDLSSQLRQAREALSNRTTELDALRAEWTSKTSGLTAKHTDELTSERQKALQSQLSLQQRLDRERQELEESHSRLVRQLEAKCHDLDTANKGLTDHKYKAEATIRELRARLGMMEEEHTRSKQEVQTLRKDNATLDRSVHDQEKEAHQLRTRLAVLEQEVKDKGEVMKRTSDLLGSEQDQKKRHEEEVDKKRRHISKLEVTIKKMSEDIIKANDIIKKLQGEIKNYHSKLKLRNQVTTEQEKLLVEKNREMEEIRRELEKSKTQLQDREHENKKLNESLEVNLKRLEESKQLVETNEKVITWLNKQINESQLSQQRGGHGPFEMNSATSYKPPSTHNYSVPSSYGAPSTLSRMSAPVSNHSNNTSPPASHPPRHPQVLYNPGQPRKSSIPHPIAKSSPIGTIPEEPPRPGDVHASPLLANNTKPREPFLDAKYFQQPGDDAPLRGAPSGPRTISPTPLSLKPSPAPAPAINNPARLSRDVIVPKTKPQNSQKPPINHPPLASAYFMGQSKVT